jgi:UDP-GlcNAc:undecaprenyl-phosphate GlcNAc-1-phosphate transferase
LTLAFAAIFILSLAFSLALTPAVRGLALRTGFVDLPDERKAHDRPIPYGGGIAIAVSFLVPIGLCCALAAGWEPFLGLIGSFSGSLAELLRSQMSPYARSLASHKIAGPLAAVCGGGGAIFALGLIDDVRKLPAWLKLLVEIAVGLSLAASGVRITCFIHAQWAAWLLTVLWVVGITNAFNLLDNMDGLSAGVALIASLIFFCVAAQTGQVFVGGALLVLAGALAGFLAYNFAPASIFMGDAGSLFIGYMLSALTVASTFYTGGSRLFPIAMPLIILSVPIFDTTSVVLIRLRERRPIYRADRSHFSHRLVALGMSRRGAVLLIYLATFAMGLGALMLRRMDMLGQALALGQTVLVFLIIALLEGAGRER